MLKNIRGKLILYIISIIFISLSVIYYINIQTSKSIIESEIYTKIQLKENLQTEIINDTFNDIKIHADNLAQLLGKTHDTNNVNNYSKKDRFYSTAIFFEPNVLSEDTSLKNTYIDESNNINYFNNIDKNLYITNDLYKKIKSTNASTCTDVYYSDLLNEYVITYATPINNSNNEFIGCVTVSFNIDALKNLTEKYTDESIHFYMIDKNGYYITNADNTLVESHQNILDSTNQQFSDIAETILSTESGTLKYKDNNQVYNVYYNTLSAFDWKIVSEFSNTYITKPLFKLTAINLCVAIASIFTLVLLIIYITNKFVHKPLHILLNEFDSISKNNYTAEVPDELLIYNNEFSNIGNSLSIMKENLKSYQRVLEDKNTQLIDNEKILKESINYSNAIISALPVIMFIFDREGYCREFYGVTPFSDRPKDFYIGKHYIEFLGDDVDKCVGLKNFLNVIKTIDYNDEVINVEISPYINGVQEHFEHSITLCKDDLVISLCRRTTDMVNQIEDMAYLNKFDELTNLHNKRAFSNLLKTYSENVYLPLSIVICDINGLKNINDNLGYDKGDELLVSFAKLLNDIDVKDKCLARIGGDEFAIVLPNTDNIDAENIMENINSICNDKLSFSIAYGIATSKNTQTDLDHLMKSAEEHLFSYKSYTSSGNKDNTIELINSAFHAKNKREQLHSNRVSELCESMAIALGFSKMEQRKIKTAGLLHDIGKIGISETILDKEGSLTDEEYREICRHPEIGYRILQSSENMKELSEYAYAHHEKWDGTGYPRKLKGEEIMLGARIIAIADTYDAMTRARAYRNGLSKEVAIAELIKCKGTQFDPDLVDIFIEKVAKDN